MEKIVNTYYGEAFMLSDDCKLVCCVIQMGTGNTKATSKLVEQWYPFSAMKDILIHNDDIILQQFFKVKITESRNFISYEFFKEEHTEELVSLFKMPNYFEGLENTAFFNAD